MCRNGTTLRGTVSGLWLLLIFLPTLSWSSEAGHRIKVSPPPPSPAGLSLSVSFEEPSGNKVLDAEEKAALLVTVKNKGPGTAHGVSLRLKVLEGGEEISIPEPVLVGGLGPKKEVKQRIPLAAGRSLPTGQMRLQVEGVVVKFQTRSFEPPRLAVVDMGIKDTSQNGQVEPMEVVKVTARVKNTGAGPASGVKALVQFGANVFLAPESKSEFTLGTLGPSQSTDVTFSFLTNKRIAAGEFMMGSPSNEPGRDSDEIQLQVKISKAYWLGETEVTQGRWKAVMGNNPSNFKNCGEDCPVEQVSWIECQEFIRRLNAVAPGAGFRLPTEVEWKFACRSGGKAELYCGGNDLGAVGWYSDNSGGGTHPVKQKKENGLGLYDMSGNVWEWCEDWKGDYPSGAVTDPTGPPSGSLRVLRGGSWDIVAGYGRSADRDGDDPGFRGDSGGFRLAGSP